MRRLIFLTAVFLTSVLGAAWAYEVQPMRQYLSIGEGVTTGLITVTNSRSEALPVELVVLERQYDENGEQTLVPNEEDFIVFPPQALIQPGESQAVRFQFIGDPNMDVSRGFVLDVREVPVQTEDFTGFKFAFNFGVAVYVKAAGSRSDSKVMSADLDDDQLTVNFVNEGRDFARLTNDRLTITINGERSVLEGEALTSRLENPVLPPRSPRTIRIDVTELDLPDGDVTVSLREEQD